MVPRAVHGRDPVVEAGQTGKALVGVESDAVCRVGVDPDVGSRLGRGPVDVVADVHAISDSFLVRVVLDDVVIEEPDRLCGRSGGEADQERIEVVEHLRQML